MRCDAGFVKVSVALNDPETGAFVGMIGCCGILNKESDLEVENLEFLLDKTEEEVKGLSSSALILDGAAIEASMGRLKIKTETISKLATSCKED